jgi:post-segregation antitoxin (ccd killing protein)
LKQLQLIQIVCINAPGCASTAFAAAKGRRVNLRWQAPNSEKTASGNADTASVV